MVWFIGAVPGILESKKEAVAIGKDCDPAPAYFGRCLIYVTGYGYNAGTGLWKVNGHDLRK